MAMNKYLTWVIVVLAAAVTLLWHNLREVKEDRNRLRANQSVLMSDLEHYTLRDSLNAVSIQALDLKVKELKENRSDILDLAADMGVKPKRIDAAVTTATKSEVEIKTPLFEQPRTEPIMQDRPIAIDHPSSDKIYAFEWRDKFTEVNGEIVNDSVSLRVYHTDSLKQVFWREPHRFLGFIKWGTKAIRQEVVSSNPNTTIIYSEYIRLVK